MLQERIMWLAAVVLVGAAAFFGGQQAGVSAGQASQTQAAQQFLAQRGGGAAGAAGRPQGGFAGPGGGQGLSGTIERVDGTTLVLTLIDGSQQTVALADDTAVRRQVEGSLADLQAGERVLVTGAQQGDTFQARAIQIGQIGGGRQAP